MAHWAKLAAHNPQLITASNPNKYGLCCISGQRCATASFVYVIREHHPSFRYRGEVRVGTLLPGGVTFYAVPREYHVGPGYR
jgi:hypothetical protein